MNEPFELTMQDPPRMNERLEYIEDLEGELIFAVFDSVDCKGEFVVIVTENRNWIVLEAEADSHGDEPAAIQVDRGYSWRADERTLTYYVRPKALFDKRCINRGVYEAAQAKDDAAVQAQAARRAAYLQADLAKLNVRPPETAICEPAEVVREASSPAAVGSPEPDEKGLPS